MKRLIDECLLSGGKSAWGKLINEDGLCSFKVGEVKYFVLLDGSTGLGTRCQIEEKMTSAEWFVKTIILKIKEFFYENKESSLKDGVEFAMSYANEIVCKFEKSKGIVLEGYEKPTASLAVMRSDGSKIEMLLLGDTQTIVEFSNGRVEEVKNPNKEVVNSLDQSVFDLMQELSKKNGISVLETMNDAEVKKLLIENRGHANNPKIANPYFICGTNLNALNHAVEYTFNEGEVKRIVLASDGFNYQILGWDTAKMLRKLETVGCNYISDKIRKAEKNDNKAEQQPRFKISDDLSILVIG